MTFTTEDNGTKTFKAVINIAQTIKIKATDASDSSLWGESNAITILSRIRQYTIKYNNTTVNNYDSNINCWVDYWTDWKIGSPVNTFVCNARPDRELVKAVAYKESTLLSSNEPNMMGVTSAALNGMTTGHADVERDPNASASQDANGCSSLAAGAPLMNYGTPTANTVNDNFKWGIRWLIAKNSVYQYLIAPCNVAGKEVSNRTTLGWWGTNGAIKKYGDPNDSNYVTDVQKLYEEGKNPHPGSPTYVWPIKADGCPRQ